MVFWQILTSSSQWVLKRFNLWDGELDYIEQLLARDVRNNSAWNQRYFVVSNTEGEGLDTARREVEFAFSYIKKGPNNQCPWNYLRGYGREVHVAPVMLLWGLCTLSMLSG